MGQTKPVKTRGLTRMGMDMACQETQGSVIGWVWNRTEPYLWSKPGMLGCYPDPLLTLHWARFGSKHSPTGRVDAHQIQIDSGCKRCRQLCSWWNLQGESNMIEAWCWWILTKYSISGSYKRALFLCNRWYYMLVTFSAVVIARLHETRPGPGNTRFI
jgi:hypothetical protein